MQFDEIKQAVLEDFIYQAGTNQIKNNDWCTYYVKISDFSQFHGPPVCVTQCG